jgi:hypothetical protein
MREYAAALEGLAATHRLYADWIEREGIHPLHVQNFKSATGAIEGLVSFLGASGKAVAEALMVKNLEDLPDMFAAASTEPQAKMALLALRKRRELYLERLTENDKREAKAEADAEALLEITAESDSGQNTGRGKRGGKPKS